MAEPVLIGLPTAPPTSPPGVGNLRAAEPFPVAARKALADKQLRANLGHATTTIRAKRAQLVAEVPGWERLREAGSQLKRHTMANLADYLSQFSEQVTARGGRVHWARDAAEANAIVAGLVQATGTDEVVKVKSMATQEIGLNEHLENCGIAAVETDLAELIVQLGRDKPSHILVPAIHRNRSEIRDIFLAEMAGVDPALTDEPTALAAAARKYLRRKFLSAQVAISGANFGVAETGTLGVVESEGNGRMCLTLPRTLITVMGIEKLVPRWADLEVFLQLLPRSSTGERMNPYTSIWTGVTPGDGPQEFHLVLLDNGRTAVLADAEGRDALNCIRCSACLNVCPVYERVGGHAYGSVYPGPIGAVLSPQLTGVADNASLPYASSLCGACYDACPVKIDIPSMLVHLRAASVEQRRAARRLPTAENAALTAASWVMGSDQRWTAAVRGLRAGRILGRKRDAIGPLPLPILGAWTQNRDLPRPPRESFRDWWAAEHSGGAAAGEVAPPAKDDSSAIPGGFNAAETARSRQSATGQARPELPKARRRQRVGAADPAALDASASASHAATEILIRIEHAHQLAPPTASAYAEIDRSYRAKPTTSSAVSADPEGIVARLIDRLLDYRAFVRRCSESGLAAAIATAMAERGLESLTFPADLPDFWLAGLRADDARSASSVGPHTRLVPDDPATPLTVAELDRIDGVLTGCALAIAETGTLILDAGPGQGRRLLTLVPDYHLCIVRVDQLVPDVPGMFANLEPTRPLTMISGPSATSDIELTRVEGVHGPRTLEVILVG